MPTKNHRKEGKPEAKMKGPRESLQPLSNSVEVDKAERNPSFLPSNQDEAYIPRIESLVSDSNMQVATMLVKRNKGAPGIDGITVQEIEKVMKTKWPNPSSPIISCLVFS